MKASAGTATSRMVGKILNTEFIFGKEIQTFSLHFEDFLVSRDRGCQIVKSFTTKNNNIVKGTIQLFPKLKVKVPFMIF
jgi:hypothetical protein